MALWLLLLNSVAESGEQDFRGPGTVQEVAAVFKEPEIPGVGKTVDQSFVVDLPGTLDGPVLTVIADKASILIPRKLVEQAAEKSGTAWKTGEERQQLIAADDAKELLVLAKSGAVPAASLKHSRYLVATLLRSGVCMVVPEGAGAPSARMVVRYTGEHAAPRIGRGMILFMLEAPPLAFFTIDWFVA